MGFSIKQKIDVCLMAEANPEMTQTDLAVWSQRRFNTSKPPSQTTISRILARKDELISLKEHEFKLIRRRRSSNPLLRKVLIEWITQCVWNNIPITAPIIVSSASNFWKQCPPSMRDGNGEFSFRWCSQFLSKVNINLSTIERDLYSNRLKVWTFEEKDGLKQLLAGIDPKKIFTLDEVFLSHDLPMDKSLYNDSSDFVTCMLCVNADGSEKLDPLIIGRYENYPCFEGKSSIKASNKHGVSYHSNRMRWLTSTLFYDWLSVLDKRLALQNRDIIIILDDSASHRVVNIKLQRIRLLYTSCSSNFLPMNWGIENDIRLNFRIKQYETLLQKQDKMLSSSSKGNNRLFTKEEQTFDMSETFDLIKHAWFTVPESRVRSAWKQSGILPDLVTQSYERRKMFDDSLEMQLIGLITQLKVKEPWDVMSLLDLTVEQKNNKTFLSNEEMVQSCIVDIYDDFDHTTGQPRRAPFSHTLGKDLQQLKRLGELQMVLGRRLSSSSSSLSSAYGNNITKNNNNQDENFMDMDIDGPDGFDFDFSYMGFPNFGSGEIPDLDIASMMDTNSPAAFITQLQPMSELTPMVMNSYPHSAPPLQQSQSQQLSPVINGVVNYGTPASSVRSNSAFAAPMSNVSQTPSFLNSPLVPLLSTTVVSSSQMNPQVQRLSIVMGFMDLILQDPQCSLSEQSKLEVVELYNRLIHEQDSFSLSPDQ